MEFARIAKIAQYSLQLRASSAIFGNFGNSLQLKGACKRF